MDCWNTLGLLPTNDRRAIKRAYFTLLKENRPDDDPLAFQRVREAYETALELSAQAWMWDEQPALEATADSDSATSQRDSEKTKASCEDDLPAWLRDAPDDEPLPAAENTPGFASTNAASELGAPDVGGQGAFDPLSEADVPRTGHLEPPETSLQEKAELAAADLFERVRNAAADEDLTAPLAALWNRREWQIPAAELALELALFGRLSQYLYDTQDECDRCARMAPWIALAAEHYGWFPGPVHRAGLRLGALDTIRCILVAGCEVCVWQLAAKGEVALAQSVFAEQLASPLFTHLDMRNWLARQWADSLAVEKRWPTGLAEMVFAAFGWEHEAGVCPPELLERYRRLMDRDLLARIAQGGVAHDYVDVAAAKALLAPRIGWKLWDASVKREWHVRINSALIWLHHNAPTALEAVEPKVLRWWASPRPQGCDSWIFMALISWCTVSLWTAEQLKPLDLNGWLWLLIMPVVIFVSATLGYNFARLLAWLRVLWVLRLYQPWALWDRRLARKTPLLRRWVDSYDIGPTRHLLPLLVLYAVELIQFERHETMSPLWENMLVALFSTLFVGVFWLGGLRMFSEAVPGAVNWLDLRDAGLDVSSHNRDCGRS